MSKKKLVRAKIEGLEELALVFGVEGVSLNSYLSHSNIEKLQEKMGEEVNVMGIVLSAPKTRKTVFLLVHPQAKDKCLLIAPDRESVEKFYSALSAIEENEGE